MMTANVQFVRFITSPAFKKHRRILADDLKKSGSIKVMPDQITRKSNSYLPVRFILKLSREKEITQAVINENFRNRKLLILFQYLPGDRKNYISTYRRLQSCRAARLVNRV